MKITKKAVREVVQSVEDQEGGEIITNSQGFWSRAGAEDSMAALQHQVAERLAEEGPGAAGISRVPTETVCRALKTATPHQADA